MEISDSNIVTYVLTIFFSTKNDHGIQSPSQPLTLSPPGSFLNMATKSAPRVGIFSLPVIVYSILFAG